jgi:hypothetical protein
MQAPLLPAAFAADGIGLGMKSEIRFSAAARKA